MFDTCRTILLTLACGASVLFASGSSYTATEDKNANRIRPYARNPRYWQYKGQPVLLLGGTKDDNLFQIPDLKEHLDLMVSVGGNYIRNTMSARVDRGFEIQAFKKLPDGKYDLNQWNNEYWNRFKRMLKLTRDRDIIVQIEVWAFHDFNKGHWEKNPWHPANNINFTSSNTTLRDSYGNIGRTAHDFFFTVPKLNNDRVVLSYQQKFVDKILSHSLRYGHVLYCMTNEIHPQYSPEWSWYWSKYIKDKTATVGRQVETTEMYWEIDLKKDQQRASLDHPEIYSYFEASQNSAKRGQENWDNLQFVYKYIAEKQRPINHTKIYGADSCPWERSTDRHAAESFWRNVLGGSASSRFHRPPYGMGLGKKAQANIRSMRMITDKMNVFTCVPHNDLLSGRKPNEAYCLARPGEQYAVYFTDGGEVTLDVSDVKGNVKAKWLNIAQSRWAKEETLKGRGTVTLSPPGTGHWVVWIGQVSTSKKAKTGSQRVGARIIKTSLGPAPEPQVLVLTNLEKWRLVQDEGYTGRNAQEFFFTLETEAGLPSPEVEVKWPGVEIERVLGADGNTTRTSEGVRFRLAQNNGAPMKTITSIDYGKNVNLILFHNWIIRRAGKYRTGRWPANEIQAQLNYLLAAREVCFDMGLAEAPDPGFVGSMGLYGFETNFPHGHVDHPPHFHILLVWPGWLSTQATHFRLDAEGSILHNEFHVNDGRNVTSRTFERGETCSCEDREGRVGFQLTILEDGSGVIWSWPDRADYMMKADSVAGSAVNAVEVFKKVNGDWERIRWVRVEYHVCLGLLKVHLSYADGKAVMEEIHFEPDTGKLLK